MTPVGGFHVPLSPDRRRCYAALAAGSGITPVLSVLATTLEAEPRSSATLLYGNRTTQSIMFLEELEDLKDRHLDRLRIFHVLSRERPEVELCAGRLDARRIEDFLDSLLPVRSVDE